MIFESHAKNPRGNASLLSIILFRYCYTHYYGAVGSKFILFRFLYYIAWIYVARLNNAKQPLHV